MAINLWRRHRRVRVGRAALGERYIKDAEAQSAARLRGLAEKRKLIERRLEDAREELAHIKDAFAGTLSTEHAQLWLLVPLLVLGLVLAVGSNLWALEPFMALEGWKRLGLSISLPVLSLIGGLAAGNGLRMPKGAPLRKVYFGVGFTVLSVIIVGVLSLNLVRGLDMTEQEQHRRASLNTTEDLDANKQEGVADASPHKNLMTALITLTSTTMGVGGELASAFAFDQLVILFIPVFTMARLRGRVRRLENKFVEIVCEEENARRPELGRAIVAAEETEVVEFQEATENKDHEMNKKKDDDDSLVPLAWRITGIVLIVATLIFISMTFAFGGTQIAVHTVILIDLSTSVEPNDEFNRDRAAVAGIIKRIKDAG